MGRFSTLASIIFGVVVSRRCCYLNLLGTMEYGNYLIDSKPHAKGMTGGVRSLTFRNFLEIFVPPLEFELWVRFGFCHAGTRSSR